MAKITYSTNEGQKAEAKTLIRFFVRDTTIVFHVWLTPSGNVEIYTPYSKAFEVHNIED